MEQFKKLSFHGIVSAIAMLLLSLIVSGQNSWLQKIEGNDSWAGAMTTDSEGNIYVSGTFDDLLLAGSKSFRGEGHNVFLAKFSPRSDLLWLRQFKGSGRTSPKALISDRDNNIYLAIHYEGAVTIQGKEFSSGRKYDVAILKYNRAGEVQWFRHIAGEGNKRVNSLAIDESDNVYIAGAIQDTGMDVDLHAFISRQDTEGNTIWIKIFNSSLQSEALDLSVRGNTLCATGMFKGSLDIEGQSFKSTDDHYDTWLTMVDLNGDLKWARHFKGAFDEIPSSVVMDIFGNIVVSGSFQKNIEFVTTKLSSVNEADVFVAKFDKQGDLQWVRQGSGGVSNDYPTDMVADASGNILVIGGYKGSIVFNNVAIKGPSTVDGPKVESVFAVKLNAEGEPQSGRHLGSISQITDNEIDIDRNNNVVIMANLDEFVENTGAEEVKIGDADNSTIYIWKTEGVNDVFLSNSSFK